MEIRLLKYFLAIAREQNISKAAIFLNTTQPNLSRQLQILEEEIGKPLFERNNKKLILTKAGLLLRKRAEEIITLTEQTEQELKAYDRSEVCGVINIGGAESLSLEIISKVIKKVQTDYPKIIFNFYSGDTSEISYKLDSGLLDFAILIEPYDLEKYDHILLPRNDIWGILMHKDMPLATYDTITTKDLWDIPLIISRHSNSYNFITNWLSKNIDELNVVATYNLIYNASLLVKEKIGYALTLNDLFNTSNTNLIYKPIYPILISKLHLAWKKFIILNKPVEIFLNYFKEELKNYGNY